MEFLIRLDAVDFLKINRDVACRISVQDEGFAVRFHYRPGQTIAIFQRDLVGKNSG